MLHLSASCHYYLYLQHTDMRKGFDSLCGIVNSQMALNALNGSVFIFLNRRRTHIKLLLLGRRRFCHLLQATGEGYL
jgi:transposase